MWQKTSLGAIRRTNSVLNEQNKKNIYILQRLARNLLVYSLVATDFGSNENEASC